METEFRHGVRTALASVLAGMALISAQPAFAQAQTWGSDRTRVPTIEVAANDTQILEVPGGAAKVFVANPGIADVEALDPYRIIIFGRKPGNSTIVVISRYGVEMKYNVAVGRSLQQLRASLADQFPDSELKVFDAPNGLTVTGTIDNAGAAEKARKFIGQFLGKDETLNFDVRVSNGSQVNLHVRVIEVARDKAESFGFNLSGLLMAGSSQIGVVTGRVPFVANQTGVGGALTIPGADTVFGRSESGLSSIGLKYSSGGDVLGGVIDALSAQNVLKVLAEPNLTAASGETANFLAGGQIPVPIARGSGDTSQVTVEWKDFGIALKFTPTIVEPGNISIKVNSEVSELSDIGSAKLGGYLIPSISTRRVETTVNLAAGQSFAIAGLFNERSSRRLEQFPVLGQIPILGELFRSRAFRSNKTELIVIVTPYLSAPANSIAAIPLPDGAPAAQSPLLQPAQQTTEPAGTPAAGEAATGAEQTGSELEPAQSSASVASDAPQMESAQ